jgi:hypothetical protein
MACSRKLTIIYNIIIYLHKRIQSFRVQYTKRRLHRIQTKRIYPVVFYFKIIIQTTSSTSLIHVNSWFFLNLFIPLFLMGLDFELSASCLQMRCSTITWAPSPVHFALVILEMQSCKLLVLNWDPPYLIRLSSSFQAWATTICNSWVI